MTPEEKLQASTYAVTYLADRIHADNREVGWWDNIDPADKREIGLKIALMHSELSEALEALRKDLQDDHLPHRSGVEVELADCMIRIMDTAAALRLDIGAAIHEKLFYNRQRADHKRENRAKSGGKAF